MKKHRLIPLFLSLLLFCTACAPQTPPPTSTGSVPSASVPEPAEKEPEHPFTADTALAGALADYPGLLRLDGTLYGESQNYIISRDGFFGSDETLAPLRDSLSTSPARYYTASRQLEDRTYETAVFDAEGRQVSDYSFSNILLLAGDILVRGNHETEGTDAPDYATEVIFTDLKTGERLWEPGRCRVSAVDGGHLAITLQPDESSAPELLIVRADDLSVVKRFENESGTTGYWLHMPVPEGCVVLSDGFYSLPLDRTFDRLEQFCGEGALLRSESGGYDLIRLSDGAVIEEGTSRRYDFWSEAVSSWTDGPGGPKYCSAPKAYGEEPVEMQAAGGYGWYTENDYFPLKRMDNTLELLGKDGTLLYSIPPEGDKLPYHDSNGWSFCETEGGIVYYGPKGQTVFIAGHGEYTSYVAAADENFCRIAAREADGNLLIDESGTVLASGLDYLMPITFTGESPPAFFQASSHGRTGLMDLDGSWLWQEEGNPLTDYFEATSDALIWLNDSLAQRTLVMVQDGVIEYDPADELDAAYLDVYPLADALTGDPARLFVESRRSNLTEDAPIETGVFNSSGGFADQYDSSSVLLLAGDILVRGNYEIQNSDGYIFATDVTFERLGTMGYGELLWEPGRCVVRAVDASHLMVCLQPDEDSTPETLLVDAATLEVVKRFPGVFGAAGSWQYEPIPDGCILLFDEGGENRTLYSLPLDREFAGFEAFCGDGAVVQGSSPDTYDVIRLSDGETVVQDTLSDYHYWSDAFSYWTGPDGQSYLACPNAYHDQILPVEYLAGGYGWESEDHFAVAREGGQFDLLDKDGRLLLSVPPEGDTPASYLGNGWFQGQSGIGTIFYAPDGAVYRFDAHNLWLTYADPGAPLFVRLEEDGTQTLLDGDGRVIVSGLQNIYQPAPEGEFLCASENGTLGLLAFDGSWLWQEDS